MNNLRDALLKAGVITEHQKRKTEIEIEARRMLVVEIGRDEHFTERVCDLLVQRITEQAMHSNTLPNQIRRLVMTNIFGWQESLKPTNKDEVRS